MPECGFSFRAQTCRQTGAHVCAQRLRHVKAFFSEWLHHTKGVWRGRPFVPAKWQWEGIIAPIFGEVHFHPEFRVYARTHRQSWLELARKNGKSELIAGIVLYLLVADDEDVAEIYGCARDRGQAKIVWDVASQMVLQSPELSERLIIRPHVHRIIYLERASYYEVLPADALGQLGHNPHGVLFDEVIAQRDDRLWTAMRTAMGSRHQPLMMAATTAGNDMTSFAAAEHAECVKIQDDPARAPHRHVYLRNTPPDADPFDERNWKFASPALGSFLSIESLREEAKEARNDPSKENSFRQFRLNQWVNQATRWMPMHIYDENIGTIWPTPDAAPKLVDRPAAWGGLDLSAKFDLTSWCMVIPSPDDDMIDLRWRFWLPEDQLPDLDKATISYASQWVKEGWLTLTEGGVIDYDQVYDDIEADAALVSLREIAYDKWSGEPVRQELSKRLGKRIPMVPTEPTYSGMTGPMTDLMGAFSGRRARHHQNPLARWCFDNVEVRRPVDNPELIRPVKPVRQGGGKRIDGVPAAALAMNGYITRGNVTQRSRRAVGF